MFNLAALPYPRHVHYEINVVDYTLPEDLVIEQWCVPAGTTVKLSTWENFGCVTLPDQCQDIRGFNIPRTIFTY